MADIDHRRAPEPARCTALPMRRRWQQPPCFSRIPVASLHPPAKRPVAGLSARIRCINHASGRARHCIHLCIRNRCGGGPDRSCGSRCCRIGQHQACRNGDGTPGRGSTDPPGPPSLAASELSGEMAGCQMAAALNGERRNDLGANRLRDRAARAEAAAGRRIDARSAARRRAATARAFVPRRHRGSAPPKSGSACRDAARR